MIENKSNTNNSIAFDVTKDDLAYNGYMALAHAICGVKDCNGVWKPISLGQVRKIFGLSERDADDVEKEKEICNIENNYFFINRDFECWSDPYKELDELIHKVNLELIAKNKDLRISLKGM